MELGFIIRVPKSLDFEVFLRQRKNDEQNEFGFILSLRYKNNLNVKYSCTVISEFIILYTRNLYCKS